MSKTDIPTSFPCFLMLQIKSVRLGYMTKSTCVSAGYKSREEFIKKTLNIKRQLKEAVDEGDTLEAIENRFTIGVMEDVMSRTGEAHQSPNDNMSLIAETLALGLGVRKQEASATDKNTGISTTFKIKYLFQAGTPEAYVNEREFDLVGCSYCNVFDEREKMSFCGACKKQIYCSKTCQKKHWKKIHKNTCCK